MATCLSVGAPEVVRALEKLDSIDRQLLCDKVEDLHTFPYIISASINTTQNK